MIPSQLRMPWPHIVSVENFDGDNNGLEMSGFHGFFLVPPSTGYLLRVSEYHIVVYCIFFFLSFCLASDEYPNSDT